MLWIHKIWILGSSSHTDTEGFPWFLLSRQVPGWYLKIGCNHFPPHISSHSICNCHTISCSMLYEVESKSEIYFAVKICRCKRNTQTLFSFQDKLLFPIHIFDLFVQLQKHVKNSLFSFVFSLYHVKSTQQLIWPSISVKFWKPMESDEEATDIKFCFFCQLIFKLLHFEILSSRNVSCTLIY